MTATAPTMTGDREAPATHDAPIVRGAAPWVASTYLAEGLPYSLVHMVIGQQYLTAMGVDPVALGLASLYHLPWNLKFLWSPLIDRYATARKWLVAAQLLLAVMVGLLVIPALHGDIVAIAWLLIPIAFVAATNDVAIDTYYMRALPDGAQSAMSGLRIGAYRVALLVGNGMLVPLAGIFGFATAFGVAAALLGVMALGHAFVLRAPERVAERPKGGLDVVKSLLDKPGIWLALAFVLSFRAGDAMMFAMNAKLLAHLGLDTTMRGIVSGGFGTAASIAGSIAGGIIVARRTLAKTLAPIALVQGTAILLYVALAALAPSLPMIALIVVAEQFIAGLGAAAFVVFILRLSAGPHKATHFAFGTAVMSLATTGVGSASGFVLKEVGFTAFFAIAFALSLPGIALSHFTRKI